MISDVGRALALQLPAAVFQGNVEEVVDLLRVGKQDIATGFFKRSNAEFVC